MPLKTHLRVLSVALPFLVIGADTDAQVTAPTLHVPMHEWGCEVLLCLANPAGPTAVAACVPPIERLWRELARGHAFPSCTEATGPHGRSFAQPVDGYYDPCPDGSAELPGMALAELVAPMTGSTPTTRSGAASTFRAAVPGALYMGIGGLDSTSGGDSGGRAPRICVADHVDDRLEVSGDSDRTIGRYRTIWAGSPAPTPQAIDVFIDDVFWERVRY